MSTIRNTRRDFLKQSMYLGAGAVAVGALGRVPAIAFYKAGSKMKLGLVTYQWGRDWALPTLIANCEASKVLGV